MAEIKYSEIPLLLKDNYSNNIPYQEIQYFLSKEEKEFYWNVCIGLNKVDNLQNSLFFLDLVKGHISSDAEINRSLNIMLTNLLDFHKDRTDRVYEADLFAVHCFMLFISSPREYLSSPRKYFNSVQKCINNLSSIHAILFDKIFIDKYLGEFRDYNISKKEKVLNNKSVAYHDFHDIESSLEKIFQDAIDSYGQIKKMKFEELTLYFSHLLTKIWTIHPFIEGNTRTSIIFFMLYFQFLELKFDMSLFISGTKKFRDALCLSAYQHSHDELNILMKKWLIKEKLS